MSQMKTLSQKLKDYFNSNPAKTTNILAEVKGNRFYITLNRPSRKNSFTSDMYVYFTELLHKANQLIEVKYIIISGKGGNFSSGNDLSNFSNTEVLQFGDQKSIVSEMGKQLSQLNHALVNSEKPIFGIVEGKVIGFAFTQLALYDRVFAVENAEFNAPLVRIAQGPEMSSSYTFPKIFGPKLFDELIIKNRKVDTAFLQKYNFVTSCKSRKDAEQALDEHLKELDVLDWNSYVNARRLKLDPERQILIKADKDEIKNLIERWMNPDLVPYLMKYMETVKKSKL